MSAELTVVFVSLLRQGLLSHARFTESGGSAPASLELTRRLRAVAFHLSVSGSAWTPLPLTIRARDAEVPSPLVTRSYRTEHGGS